MIVITMIVITVLAGQKNVRMLKDLVQVILGKEEKKLYFIKNMHFLPAREILKHTIIHLILLYCIAKDEK